MKQQTQAVRSLDTQTNPQAGKTYLKVKMGLQFADRLTG